MYISYIIDFIYLYLYRRFRLELIDSRVAHHTMKLTLGERTMGQFLSFHDCCFHYQGKNVSCFTRALLLSPREA